MKPEIHKEDFLLKKVYELLNVLMVKEKIALLFTYVDSHGVLQSYGSELVKAKWEEIYQHSKSWKERFKTDQRLLNVASTTDQSAKDARRIHQEESVPARLPAPLSSMDIGQLISWLTVELKREYIKKTGITKFKLLLKKEHFEPPWWLSSWWPFSECNESLSTVKFTGEGDKIDFLRATAESCLQHYDLDGQEHVIPTYDHSEHVAKMKRKGKIVPERSQFEKPDGSDESSPECSVYQSNSSSITSPASSGSLPSLTTDQAQGKI